MVKSHFVPNDFIVTDHLKSWAKTTFNISDKEVDRQVIQWRLHEYKRAYSDWAKACQRWFYQADKYGELRRDYKLRTVEELTAEEQKRDAASAIAQMDQYRSKK